MELFRSAEGEGVWVVKSRSASASSSGSSSAAVPSENTQLHQRPPSSKSLNSSPNICGLCLYICISLILWESAWLFHILTLRSTWIEQKSLQLAHSIFFINSAAYFWQNFCDAKPLISELCYHHYWVGRDMLQNLYSQNTAFWKQSCVVLF